MNATPTALHTLRNVYSAEQFAAEILCGQRSVEWVQDQCRMRRIKTVARRPWMIPQIEAVRFVNPDYRGA